MGCLGVRTQRQLQGPSSVLTLPQYSGLSTLTIGALVVSQVETVGLEHLRHATGLKARDLFFLEKGTQVDFDRPNPSILPQQSAIMVSLSHIKAIIAHDRLYLFDIDRPVVQYFALGFGEYLKGIAGKELELDSNDTASRIGADNQGPNGRPLAFELKALDGILTSLGSKYSHRLSIFEPTVINVLTELEGSSMETHVSLSPSSLREALRMRNTLYTLQRCRHHHAAPHLL